MPGTALKLSPALTLPRRLHRAVLRLVRPAESAVRRLVVVAARGIVVELPPSRPRKPKPNPKSAAPVPPSLGIAVLMTPAEFAAAAAERAAAAKQAAARANRMPSLPLLDTLRLPRLNRRRYTPAHAAPRILSFDGRPPHRLPPPPSPDDMIDATPLARRLTARSTTCPATPAASPAGRRAATGRWRRAAGTAFRP